jgi:PhnB protein
MILFYSLLTFKYLKIMAKLNPYLNFDGTCEEAFNFYKTVFGGEFKGGITKMKDLEENNLEGMTITEEDREKVMHVCLPIGDELLMGSDVMCEQRSLFKTGNNNYISVFPDSREEADRLFNELSAGGEVEMPMEDVFWGDYFGSFKDKYDIYWMINYNPEDV